MSEVTTLPVKVSDFERRRSLEWGINNLIENGGDSFVGPILQCLSITYSDRVPTLGVMFNKKTRVFELHINPEFFCHKLNDTERVAVLKHEVFHIINKHVYFNTDVLAWDKMQANVAMDLVINQYIKGLPEGCLFVKNFTDKNDQPLKLLQTVEYYYDAIQDDAKYKKPSQGDGKEGQGEGKGSGKGNEKGDGQGNAEWVKAKDYFKSPEQGFDVHGWQDAGVDPSEILEATADLVKRAMTKVNYDYSKIPSSIRDLLEEIQSKIKGLNYKAILMATLRKSLPAKHQRLTWKKPSRRYGEEAKGRISALMPRLELFGDSSGSISVEELNYTLDIMRGFLTVGVEEAHINLFHTSNYFRKKMKKNFKFDKSMVQSGGTDLTESLKMLTKQRCDLAIVITDGYFDMPNVDVKKLPQMVFLISKGGQLCHPLHKVGKTMFYKP